MASSHKTLQVLGLLAVLVTPTLWALNYFLVEVEVGALCFKHGDCRSGLCFLRSGILPTGQCTEDCARDEDCPGELACRPAGARTVCMDPPRVSFGGRCFGPEDCLAERCLAVSSRPAGRLFYQGFCAQPCGAGDACPEGGVCARGDEGSLCVPEAAIALAEARYVRSMDELGVSPPPDAADRAAKDALLAKLGAAPQRGYALVPATEFGD